MKLLIKGELLKLFKHVMAGVVKHQQQLIEWFRLFVLKLSFHFLVVAQDAVIVGGLVEIFDDPLVEFFDIDVAIVVEVIFDVLDDLEDDAAC